VRLTPAQGGMRLLLGEYVWKFSTDDLKSNIFRARKYLVNLTGEDFGYDAMKSHEYLWATDAGGYKWCRRSTDKWARVVREAMARPEWAEAVRELEEE